MMAETRIELQARDSAANHQRAWRLEAGRDLFGAWSTEVQFGRIGCSGRTMRRAFVTEVQEWISAVARGEHTGSTSWDGYAAACVCDAGVRALTDDGVVKVEMIAKPDFYV